MKRLYTKEALCYCKPEKIEGDFAYLYGKEFQISYDDIDFVNYTTIRKQSYILEV